MMTNPHGSAATGPWPKPGLTLRGWRGYLGSLLAVAAATALRRELDAYVGGAFSFSTYLAAVALSAMLAGWQAGLVATALSALAADYYFVEPRGALVPQTAAGWLGLTCFLGTGALVSWIANRLNQARRLEAHMAEHVRTQEEARVRDARYRTVLTNSPVAVWECDRELRFTFIDNPQPPLTDPALFLGKRDDELLPAESVRELVEMKRRVLLTGVAERGELPLSHPGGIAYFDFWVDPMRDARGELTGLRGVGVNITERKRAQAQIAADLEAMKQLQQLGSRCVASGEPGPALEAVLEAAIRITGADFSSLQVLDPGASELRIIAQRGFSQPWVDFWNRVSSGQGCCGTALSRRQRVIIEDIEQSPLFQGTPALDIQLKAGVRAVQSTPLVSRSGELLGMFSTHYKNMHRPDERALHLLDLLARQAADLIERAKWEEALQESEARFRLLADSMPNLAWWADADGTTTWYNQRWYEYTGTTPAQMEQRGWESFHDPKLLPGVLEQWQTSVASGNTFELEFPLRRADGEFRWFLTRATPLRDAQGQPVRWFGTNTDITEIRAARLVLVHHKQDLEDQVAERTARLSEMVAELEHFSYTITHDMRAPLRAMQGFAQLVIELSGQAIGEQARMYLGRIMLAGQRMDALVRDALNYSRAVRTQLPLSPVDLGALLRGMLDSYPEFQAARAGTQLTDPLPMVLGNEAGLTQCFSNLIGNALKFAKPGQKPSVRIRAEPCAAEAGIPRTVQRPADGAASAGWVRLWVEDHGIGISKTMLPKVFDMFSRGTSAQPGTGIGLALVRKVVDRMGGRVGVESEDGEGSRFWLELRVAQVQEIRESQSRAPQEQLATGVPCP